MHRWLASGAALSKTSQFVNPDRGDLERVRTTITAVSLAIRSRVTVAVAVLLMTHGIQSPGQSPQLGAQIWIERGQNKADIDGWFHTLAVAHMPVARIFLMWSDLERAPDQWDFTEYDEAFRAAEKEHVRIIATLTPNGAPPFRMGQGTQGIGVVGSSENSAAAAAYIRKVVLHYRDSPSLDTWLLLNEPGQKPELQPLAVQGFSEFVKRKYPNVAVLNQSWGTNFANFGSVQPPDHANKWNPRPEIDWYDYWRTYQTARLQWLASQVRAYDMVHPLHLNPAGLIQNLAENSDDLPKWRAFLDTLGCSIHPGWHFSLLPRERYTLGVSFINDLVRGSIQPKPYWVTELQGGNNISSASQPIDPTEDEIRQWVWTSIGAGAKRVIFWLLNSRSVGVEAGEWSLLDFQQRPSGRLRAASAIADQIARHEQFFEDATPVASHVSLLLSLQTQTLEANTARKDDPARDRDAQVLALLGYYRALATVGTPPNVRHIDDYEWESTESGRIVILPDVRALSEEQVARMRGFVEHGNTILLSGLTGFYDTSAGAWAVPMRGKADQALATLTGARLKEVFLVHGKQALQVEGTKQPLPYHLWKSSLEIVAGSGTRALSTADGDIYATERTLSGGGHVLWMPSLVETAAWLGDTAALTAFLRTNHLEDSSQPFRFLSPSSQCILRTLEHGPDYVTIVANGSGDPADCALIASDKMTAQAFDGSSNHDTTTLRSMETRVTLWTKHR